MPLAPKAPVLERDSRVITPSQAAFPFTSAAIFGAGSRGLAALRLLRRRGVEVTAVHDNSPAKQGADIEGVPVLAPARAMESGSRALVVCSQWEAEILRQLVDMGYPGPVYCFRHYSAFLEPELLDEHAGRLEACLRGLADDESREAFSWVLLSRAYGEDGYLRLSPYPQYMHPLVRPEPGDVVLDAGGHGGETSAEFLRRMGGRGRIYCFEPCAEYFERLQAALSKHRLDGAITPVGLGLWSGKDRLRFRRDLVCPGGSCVDPQGDEVIEVTSVDDFVTERGLERVDLIKADIEGAEMEMLRGARGTIERHAPKLQISVYHRKEHLWEAQEFLSALPHGYVFHLGQHSMIQTETVLYARPSARAGA